MNNDLISREALKKAIKSYADDQRAENEYLGEYAIMAIIDNVPTYKSPCDYCIELECENHGVVCPHYRAYMREADNDNSNNNT